MGSIRCKNFLGNKKHRAIANSESLLSRQIKEDGLLFMKNFMRETFYGLLVILLVFMMWKGVAFKITIDGEPKIVEFSIGVMDDQPKEEE